MPKKILIVSHYAELYGANLSLLTIIKSLVGSKEIVFDVVLPKWGDFADELKKLDVTPFIVQFPYCVNAKPYYGGRLGKIKSRMAHRKQKAQRKKEYKRALHTLIAQYASTKVDLVYSNSSVIAIGFELSKKLRAPHVFHVREFAVEHYGFVPDYGEKKFYAMFAASERVIFISESIAHYFAKKEKITSTVIYNGVFTQREAEQIKLINRENTRYTFSIVGLISKNKRQDDAVRAMAMLKERGVNCRLEITGGGNDNKIKNLVKELGLEQEVSLRGYVSETAAIYEQTDCLLMCSLYEGMGRVTVEAMFYGLPVIGYNSGATPELIVDDETGFIVEPNYVDLANKMQFLAENKTRGENMGKAGRARAHELFLTEKYCESVIAEFKTILEK